MSGRVEGNDDAKKVAESTGSPPKDSLSTVKRHYGPLFHIDLFKNTIKIPEDDENIRREVEKIVDLEGFVKFAEKYEKLIDTSLLRQLDSNMTVTNACQIVNEHGGMVDMEHINSLWDRVDLNDVDGEDGDYEVSATKELKVPGAKTSKERKAGGEQENVHAL